MSKVDCPVWCRWPSISWSLEETKAASPQSKREFFCLMAFKLKHQLFPAFWTQNGILLALLGLQTANTPCRFGDLLSANSLYPYNKSLYVCMCYIYYSGFPGGTSGKESICQCRRHKEAQVWSLVWEDPLEEGIATHSSILAWRIPWTEEPGGLQSKGSQRVKHNWSDSGRAHILHMYVWSRLLRVPWTARSSNQSILKEINPEYSLEGLMLKLQYFGHLMRRANSLKRLWGWER